MTRRAVLLLAVPSATLAVGPRKIVYVGGTITTVAPGREGDMATDRPDELVYVAEDGYVAIPWGSIERLEYGQKAERMADALKLSPGLFSLFKRRQHYFTIGYRNTEGARQTVTFEMGKDIYQEIILQIRLRSRVDLDFGSEEARKNFR